MKSNNDDCARRATGPMRILVVCSAVWLSIVAFDTHREFNSVDRGEASPRGFAVLRDANTGRTFGRLSKSEVQELGNLEAELARREKRESKEAKELLAASLVPAVSWATVAKWTVIPLLILWAAYFSLRWIVNGFRAR